jgi:hypothetical protein
MSRGKCLAAARRSVIIIAEGPSFQGTFLAPFQFS